jgi:TolA-binding protein
MTEEKKVITIDDVEYTEDQLSDVAKHCINQIKSLEANIRGMELKIEQMQVGRAGYMEKLKAEIKEED